LKYCWLTLVFFIALAEPLYSQVPDFSKVPNLHEGDSLNITLLINNGMKITEGKAICWFPKDSLSQNEMNEIASMVDAGISGAEKFINAPLPWQVHPFNEPYTFYFRADRFISHASLAGFVSVPFWRIKAGKAPWLHEVLHEMLYSKTQRWYAKTITDREFDEQMPLWLFEGLPDYISLKVSMLEGLPWFDVFSSSRETNIDSLFIKDISSEKGPYILSFIGKNGVMPELSSDQRIQYAPAFYHGSSSFVDYLASNYGLEILFTSISLFQQEQGTIEKLTGKSIDTLKKEWLSKFNFPSNRY